MDNIFDKKFTFEQKTKDEVITYFSNKQGGDFNVFAYHWQCFAWAAVIGFLRDLRKPLSSPKADQVFNLNTMMNNGGECVAKALICMCIAKAKSLDIMKDPTSAIEMINEYANGGFYYIMDKIVREGKPSNDLEWVKQEIFNRDINETKTDNKVRRTRIEKNPQFEKIEALPKELREKLQNQNKMYPNQGKRWTEEEMASLKEMFNEGTSIDDLTEIFGRNEGGIISRLVQLGLIEAPEGEQHYE